MFQVVDSAIASTQWRMTLLDSSLGHCIASKTYFQVSTKAKRDQFAGAELI
jgi:hypothetical protein